MTIDEEVWSNFSQENNNDDGGSKPDDVVDMEDNPEPHPENGCAGIQNVIAFKDKATTPLYCGSSISRLDTTLMFINVCRTHKMTNACISELLHLLSKVILPTPNSLPSSERMARQCLAG